MVKKSLSDNVELILQARHHDPFAYLGAHRIGDLVQIRVFIPNIQSLSISSPNEANPNCSSLLNEEFELVDPRGLYEWSGPVESIGKNGYQLSWIDKNGREIQRRDPYSFERQIPDYDLHLFCQGQHWHIYRYLGANLWNADGVEGVLFATWAPNAERVSVVGDFNHWDGRVHCMRSLGGSGVWEIFIPDLKPGSLYKFEIRVRDSGAILVKSDPYARQFELRPNTASIIAERPSHQWQDSQWMQTRAEGNWLHTPVSIYEIHLASWRRPDKFDEKDTFYNYREIAAQLIPYILEQGFTHIELLPITEYPYDGSWGYQALGYFAPTSRFGTPDDFRYFVDQCHQSGIGVLLDWVPAHFPSDSHGLARFDGSCLYEHEDPRKGEHRDWGTYIYNYGRKEVKNFLLASALFWLDEYHLDGLRVDAVASMLYLDYSREPEDWVPNQYGGNENLEAIDFLRELNTVTHDQHPGTIIMAEESTAWPQVSRPTWLGGLGFSMKWNMGWMHDILSYFEKDPVHRHYHHDQLTFGLLYSFTENFILPLSHDEVVHGKRSLRYKMPGDEWQQFANLRLLYAFMFAYPGKKLLFMGNEFGQGPEWNADSELDWYTLDYPLHQGLHRLVSDLNGHYRNCEALHFFDFDPQGFDWIDCHDGDNSAITFMRRGPKGHVLIVLNFTPIIRYNYRIGVPGSGNYREIINTDSEHYGGSNVGNGGLISTDEIPWMNQSQSVSLTLPPLAGLILQPA